MHMPKYFVAGEGQLFYEFNGSQNLPIPCGTLKVHLTNMKDILLIKEDENTENVLLNIRSQDVESVAELQTIILIDKVGE